MASDRRFAERFRDALRESGMTQTGLSEKTGIPLNAIGTYYRGYCSPRTEERRRRLALALGKSEDYFSPPQKEREREPCASSAGKEHWRWQNGLF